MRSRNEGPLLLPLATTIASNFRVCVEEPEVRDSRTSWFGTSQRSIFLVLTERVAASGDDNVTNRPQASNARALTLSAYAECINTIKMWFGYLSF